MRLLFLCTGNACRSQMAEGWMRHLAAEAGFGISVASAGIVAHGLNPRAVAVMAEAGVDIREHQSNELNEFDLENFDIIVTVCGDADDNCPALPVGLKKIHWPLEDPAKLPEAHAETGFRASRDDIRQRVQGLLNSLFT